MARRLRWLPNALTIGRLLALPVLLWVVFAAEGPTSTLAAWLYMAVALTDFVDGILARLLHAESAFGRIADPLADRLLVAVGLVGLIAMERFAWPGPTIILVRDAVAILAFALLARRGVVLRVDFWGKASSTWNMVLIAVCLWTTLLAADILFWIGVGISVVTFLNYARVARAAVRAAPAGHDPSPSTSA